MDKEITKLNKELRKRVQKNYVRKSLAKKPKRKLSKTSKILIGITCVFILIAVFFTVLNSSNDRGYNTDYYNTDYEIKEPQRIISPEEQTAEDFSNIVIQMVYWMIPIMMGMALISILHTILRRSGVV